MAILLYETPICFYLLDVTENSIKKLANSKLDDPELFAYSLIELQNNKIPDSLKSFLQENFSAKELFVTDKNVIKIFESCLECKISFDESLVRKVKENLSDFVDLKEYTKSLLCISHKIANNKLEQSEKMDILIVETLQLLDSLEKDLNLHVMRIKEWYSLHFPELQDLILNNEEYLIAITEIKRRNDFLDLKKDDLLLEKYSKAIKPCENSMGCEFETEDIEKIINECKNVLNTFKYKEKMIVYLEERVNFIAPNLVALVGPIVACRFIAGANTLINLSKMPSSTIQILGAERTFFEAIKNKQNTPKFGFIYNAPLVVSTPVQLKGAISRSLAAKAALAAKIDAFDADSTGNMGKMALKKLEERLDMLKSNKKKRK